MRLQRGAMVTAMLQVVFMPDLMVGETTGDSFIHMDIMAVYTIPC